MGDRKKKDKTTLSLTPIAVMLLVVWALVVFLIALALYLQFNEVGAQQIVGVQERYFLPLILPLLLALVFMVTGKTCAFDGEGSLPGDKSDVQCVASEYQYSRLALWVKVLILVMVFLNLFGLMVKLF